MISDGSERSEHSTTRREALRRFLSVGVAATAAAGLGELLTSPLARADQAPTAQVAVADVLAALPPDASPQLIAAIQSSCCTHYTVAQFHCGSGGCGSGFCCYHIVSTACGIDTYACLNYPCSHGNFSSGC
jgi:hypothetical protein